MLITEHAPQLCSTLSRKQAGMIQVRYQIDEAVSKLIRSATSCRYPYVSSSNDAHRRSAARPAPAPSRVSAAKSCALANSTVIAVHQKSNQESQQSGPTRVT